MEVNSVLSFMTTAKHVQKSVVHLLELIALIINNLYYMRRKIVVFFKSGLFLVACYAR